MNLDLEKFTIARRKFPGNHAGMAYLIQPIRRELEERARLSRPSLESVLVIDFEDGCFEFPEVGNVEYSSLFDSGLSNSESVTPIVDLPCSGALFDCVVSNLQGTWFEFETFLRQVKRVLKPGGAFCFSAFGPDTLAEIHRAWKRVDSCPHVHPFIDMHHLGDTLLKTGFEKTIVDADWIQVEYDDCMTVIADLRSEGFINLHTERRKSLTGKHRFKQFESHLLNQMKNGKKLIITFEIIYGYAQKPLHPERQVLVSPPSATYD